MEATNRMKQLHKLGELAKQDVLTLANLRPGDLLFAINKETQKPVHVTIVSTQTKSGAVRELHQVEAKGFQGLHENDVVPEGLLVVRCRRTDLAKKAACYALKWSDVPAPYSSLRAAIAKDHEKKYGDNLVQIHRQLFEKSAKFRAIKYAARRKGTLVTISEQPSIAGNKGMFCSMFVTICYQVAGLESVVGAADERQTVSDKRMDQRKMKSYRAECLKNGCQESDVDEYENYLKHLHEFEPYDLDTDNSRFKAKGQDRKKPFKLRPAKFSPSFDFWCADVPITQFSFPNAITEGMMVDAKVIYPAGLLQCLQADTKNWRVVGALAGKRKFSETREQKNLRMGERQKQIDKTYQ